MFNDQLSLSDFIEMPSYRCLGTILSDGIKNLGAALQQKNGANTVMSIMEASPYISTSFLLADLAEKISMTNDPDYANLLLPLYEQCLERIAASVYNPEDLERCIKACPAYADKILNNILSDDQKTQRILTAYEHQDIEKTRAELCEKYPAYAGKWVASIAPGPLPSG